MGRRATGEGSIYRRQDGRYAGAAYVLTTTGKRTRKTVYGKTRQEVHDALAELIRQDRLGVPVPERTWKLGNYLDYWFTEVIQPNLRPTTAARYETVIRLHLKPGLGHYPLPRLTVALLQTFLNEQRAKGKSVRSVHIMRQVLSSALSQACREELLVRNVARLVRLPSYRGRRLQPWSGDEVRRFLITAQTDLLFPAFVLLGLYGLRRGEVLGLRWGDIKTDAAMLVLQIRQQLQRVRGRLELGPVKTEAGERDLPLLDVVRQLVALHWQHQQAARTAAGASWHGSRNDDELVFTTRSGLPIEPRNLVRSFHRIREQASLRFIRLHDLRHTATTLLKNFKVPDKDIQLILGHSDVAVTRRIYEHGDFEGQRAGLVQAEALLLPAGAPVSRRCSNRGDSCQRSCQNLLSSHVFVDQITSSISGSGEWTRTTDPRLMRSPETTLRDLATEVNRIIEGRRKQWLLGLVAVKYSCQPPESRGP